MESIETLRRDATACRRCPLGAHRKQVVLFDGTETHPDVLFVGQSPGPTEDDRGLPFVGASGTMLREAIHQAGLGSYGFINLTNCYVQPGHWDDAFAVACAPFLDSKLLLYQPKRFYVAVGRDAQRFMWRRSSASERLYPLTPQTARVLGLKVLHLIHPSAVLRRGSNQTIWAEDWEGIRAELRT